MDSQLPQLLINGISIGSILALAAVGLTLTYGILRLSNFAHGDYMTLGAYLTLFAKNLLGLNIWFSLGVGSVATVGIILLIEKLIWSKMRAQRANATTLIIISIGLALFIRNFVLLIWGGENQTYGLPVAEALSLFGLRLPYYNLLVVGMAVTTIAALHYLLQNTRIGKAMRAVADDIDLARVTGINVEQVILWTWIIAGGLTALSGGMLGLVQALRPNMGWFLILPLFASVILGGIGNPYGAIAGAFVIGIAQEVSTYFLHIEYKLAVALIIMVLVLAFRPQGIFRGTM
jgi:neutral amino acid transport system permease protein